jgi:hypothetical protein
MNDQSDAKMTIEQMMERVGLTGEEACKVVTDLCDKEGILKLTNKVPAVLLKMDEYSLGSFVSRAKKLVEDKQKYRYSTDVTVDLLKKYGVPTDPVGGKVNIAVNTVRSRLGQLCVAGKVKKAWYVNVGMSDSQEYRYFRAEYLPQIMAILEKDNQVKTYIAPKPHPKVQNTAIVVKRANKLKHLSITPSDELLLAKQEVERLRAEVRDLNDQVHRRKNEISQLREAHKVELAGKDMELRERDYRIEKAAIRIEEMGKMITSQQDLINKLTETIGKAQEQTKDQDQFEVPPQYKRVSDTHVLITGEDRDLIHGPRTPNLTPFENEFLNVLERHSDNHADRDELHISVKQLRVLLAIKDKMLRVRMLDQRP